MNLKDLNISPFYLLDKEWALLSSGNKDGYNSMPISWGGFGILYNKPVVSIYVRPDRFTYKFLENNKYFTLSFFDDKYKKDLMVLGTKSGKDCDKISLTNLTPIREKNYICFKEAKITMVCKKVHYKDLDKNNFLGESINNFYAQDPTQKMFVGEVVNIIDKR